MAEYNIGTARGRIDLDASGATRGAATANKALDSVDKKRAAVDKGMTTLGKGMLAVGAAAAAGIGLAIKVSADFEKELSAFGAVTGVPEAGMEKIRQKALQLGRDTAFGAGEAAGAMTELGKAGLSVEDILGGAADATVALAAAGEVDLAEAAKISAAALNQFKLEASDLPGVADLLAGAANASATGVSEIGAALSYVGPVAQSVGLSIEDTAGAVALLANNGIDGQKAGTALRAVMSRLQGSSIPAKNALKELGIVTEDGANAFYNADGSMKSMSEVIGILNGSMSGLTKQQQQAYAQTIFGQEALAAVSVMAGSTSEEFDSLQKSIGAVSAEDVAQERLNNLAGSLQILRGTIETALISLGSHFQPALKSVVDTVTSVINAFAAMNPETQKFIAFAIAGAAAIGIFGGGLLLAAVKIRQTMATVQALGGIFKIFSAGPIGIAIVAIAALAAGLVYLYKNSETFRSIVQRAFTEVGKAVDWLRQTFNNLMVIGKVIWKVLTGEISSSTAAFNPLTRAVSMLRQGILLMWKSAQPTLIALRGLFTTVFQIIGNVIATVVRVIQGLWARFGSTITSQAASFLATLFRTFVKVFQDVQRFLQSVFGFIQSILRAFIAAFRGDWSGVLRYLGQAWQHAWNAIRALFSAVTNAIKGIVSAFARVFGNIWNAFAGVVSRVWSSLWNGVLNFFRSWSSRIRSAVSAAVNLIRAAFNLNFISTVWRNIWNGIRNWFSNTFGPGLRRAVSGVVDSVRNAFNRIRNTMASPVNWVIDNVINKFLNGVEKIAGVLGLDLNLPRVARVPTFHTGGVVGEGQRPTKSLSKLKKDETLALLRDGEEVITEDDERHIKNQGGKPNDVFFPANPGSAIGGIMDWFRGGAAWVAERTVNGAMKLLDGMAAQFGMPGRLFAAIAKKLGTGIVKWIGGKKEKDNAGPDLGGGVGYQKMFAAIKAAFPWAILHSGYRPGAITATGNRSYHGMGRAVDVTPSMEIAEWIRKNYMAATRELIFSPMGGRQIHNGRNHMYSGITRSMHWDHVHWAMAMGGIVKNPIMALLGEAGPEAVVPLSKLGGFFADVADMMMNNLPLDDLTMSPALSAPAPMQYPDMSQFTTKKDLADILSGAPLIHQDIHAPDSETIARGTRKGIRQLAVELGLEG